jgi:uncharacterized repeat protein (TIGR01451 family)
MSTDLQVAITDGATSIVPGTPDTYTITVTNNGPDTVSSVTLTDTAPAALLNPVFGTPSAGSYNPISGVWSGLSLASGQSVTITLTGTVDPNATGSLTSSVTVSPPPGVTDSNPANNSASDTDTLAPRADLSVTMTDSKVSVVPGTSDTYTITVSNNGPSAVTGASVADVLPAGVTAATWMATGNSGGGSVSGPTSGSGALATTVNLPVSASVTFSFTASINSSATGSLTNTVTVSPPAGVTDSNPANNSASDIDTLAPGADLSVTMTDGQVSAVPGTSDTYTITVSNNGPSAVTGASIADALPAGVTAATWMATGNSGGGSVSGPTSGSGAMATTVNLPVGASVTFSLTATIDPSATGSLTNTVTVSPPVGTTDSSPTNNSATDSDTLTPQADLSITNSDGVAAVFPGASITYNIVVHNAGPSTAVGQQVSDLFSSAIAAASWTAAASPGSSVAATSGTGNIFTPVTLLAGGTAIFTAVAQISPSATGSLTNTATVAVPSGDTTPGDNVATDTDTLLPAVPALTTTPNSNTVTLGSSLVILADAATLAGGFNPTGTITFSLVHSGTVLDTETVAVNGNSTYSTPTGFTLPSTGAVTGAYQWNATYSGDGNNSAVSEINNPTEHVTVSKSSSTLTTTPNSNAVTLRSSPVTLTDKATLAGGYNPTGTITFTLVHIGTVLDTETVAVNGNGTYSTPTGFTLPSTGTVTGAYQWNATYSGDGNNNAASEINNAAEQVTVNPAPYDFNGDRTSDVLLQNGGTVVDWMMANGAYQNGNVITNGASGYTIVGTGDFNADGTTDVLLQNGGTVVDWIMKNGTYQSGNVITNGASGYKVVGTGDLNGDGTADVVLQNGGTVVDWIMQNGVYQSGNVLTNAALGWTVVGAGDVSGDGTSDILLQNGGTVVDWIMKNGTYQNGNVLTNGAAGWTVVGTGDFNGDGTTDILLQNGGTVVDWIMGNGVYQSGNVITNGGAAGWSVVGTGDYNGDGTSDVLLQNGGTVVDWTMKNGVYQGGNVITNGAAGWSVARG